MAELRTGVLFHRYRTVDHLTSASRPPVTPGVPSSRSRFGGGEPPPWEDSHLNGGVLYTFRWKLMVEQASGTLESPRH